MGLKNEEGNYLKIIGVVLESNTIVYEIYKSQELRTSGLDDRFERSDERRSFLENLSEALSSTPDAEKSVKDNVISKAYLALKSIEEFSKWIDC